MLGGVNDGLAHHDRGARLRAGGDGWHRTQRCRCCATSTSGPAPTACSTDPIAREQLARAVIDEQVAAAAHPALGLDRGVGWPARPRGLDDQGLRDRGLPAHLERLLPARPARPGSCSSTSRARPPTAGSSTTPATRRWSPSTAAPPRSTATTSPSGTSACPRRGADPQAQMIPRARSSAIRVGS